jgi:PBP1b-binding outer membrane lipoprotein LpoB
MKGMISLVAILVMLLGGCAMSSTSSTDASRDPAAPQPQPPKSGGSGY